MGLDPHKRLAKMHKYRYMQDQLWREVMNLNLMKVKKPLQKFTCRY